MLSIKEFLIFFFFLMHSFSKFLLKKKYIDINLQKLEDEKRKRNTRNRTKGILQYYLQREKNSNR